MTFSVEDYMKMAEKPKIILYGMKGIAYEMEMQKVCRPTAQEVRNICRNHCNGVVSFTDTFIITMKTVDDPYKAELYYGDQLVAMRMFPPIFMMLGDTLELTFNLCIYADNGRVLV